MKTSLFQRIRGILLALILAASTGWLPRIAAAQASPTPSISELLEKGIYTEETKGDIPGAIAVYKQLIVQASANDALAAEAEFRLAQCYLKQGDKDQATAEFNRLVEKYPNEKQWVAKAKAALGSAVRLDPAPWVDGERLVLKFTAADGSDIGIEREHEDLVQSGTQSIWRVGRIQYLLDHRSASTVDVDADSFSPLSSDWKLSLFGHVRAVYRPGEVELWRDGQSGSTKVKTFESVIDNEEAIQYMRRLPLKEGFETTVPIFSTIGGEPINIKFKVAGIESVQTPAGQFTCFKINLDVVGQSFWISDDPHRYLVQIAAGSTVAKLISITQQKPNQLVSFHDDDLGVSLQAPSDWLVCRLTPDQPEENAQVRIYDPNADMQNGAILYIDMSKLPDDEKTSLKIWAQNATKDIMKMGADVTVRPDSWKDSTLAGQPALSFIADYKVNGKPKTMFVLSSNGPKDATRFLFDSDADKFDALMNSFDTIIASYQRK